MRSRSRAGGVLALLLLIGILAGLPAVLIAVGGNPLPATWPTLDQVRATVLAPDDGTFVLAATTLLGWAVWAALTVSIVTEVAWQVRGVRPPALPGLALPQGTVQALVSTALALFMAAPIGADVATAAAASNVSSTSTIVPAQAPAVQPATSADVQPASTAAPATRTYTVQPGDTLWSIARTHLGSGRAFSQIVDLNPAALKGGADWISPGMTLLLPAPAAAEGPDDQGPVTVVEGDTLSALAQQHLHDGDRWPELYQATADLVQPDGRTMTDPDLIYPGWQVVVPKAASGSGGASSPTGEHTQPEAPRKDATPTQALDLSPALAAGQELGHAGATPTAREQARPIVEERSTEAAAGPEAGVQNAVAAPGYEEEGQRPAWLLNGLVGSGALLGAGLFLALAARRRTQFRHRRPGRGITPVEPALAPVEMTVQTEGAAASVTLQDLDQMLRRLGARCATDSSPVPAVAAVHLATEGLTLHLSEPAQLGTPWEGSPDQLRWHLPAGASADQVGPLSPDAPAPYPLLVSIGTGDDGSAWLLNLEDLQVALTGDQDHAADLARYLAAEIAVNPWSVGVRLDCIGVAEEVEPMNPDRISISTPTRLPELLAEAGDVTRRLGPVSDVATARTNGTGAETWPARMLLLGAGHLQDPALADLAQLLQAEPGRTGTAIVMRTEQPQAHTVQIVATAEGRLLLPDSGLDLIGVGLTPDEARGCAALLSQSTQVEDAPVPSSKPNQAEQKEPWRTWADDAGALRAEHTLGRDQDDDGRAESHSLLPAEDQNYLDVAATTPQDLASLAPRIPDILTRQVIETDPTLDEDLAAWWDPQARLPRLTLLGPVAAKTWGKPMLDRRPYFTELLAYLALHPCGVTPAEAAEAFSITVDKCRDYISRARDWLGENPRTDLPHLPPALDAPAAQARGVNLYQVLDVLVDADLFRRLRTRAEARGGPEGIADLRQALRLVQGQPFTQLRRGGWGWLFEGDRLDQHMVCAIVDVAHLLAVHDMQAGDLDGARSAAQVAVLAAPHEEISTLDLAAVAAAEGRHGEAVRILKGEVCDRADNPDGVPEDLPDRTQQILDGHRWLDRRMAG